MKVKIVRYFKLQTQTCCKQFFSIRVAISFLITFMFVYFMIIFNALEFSLNNQGIQLYYFIIFSDFMSVLPMKSGQFNSFLTSCFLQNTQYLHIQPLTYHNQSYEKVIWIYDDQKFKKNANLIDEYKSITGLQLQPHDQMKLEVRVSLQGKPEVWKAINEDIYIETWLNGEGLAEQQKIYLRFTVQKEASYLGQSAYISYGSNYFNSKGSIYEQLGFYIPHLDKVYNKKCKGNQRLITYLKEIKELGEKYDVEAYELRVMKFSLKSIEIGPMIVINAIDYETGRRYIENKSMIEIRKRDYENKEKTAVNLRILGDSVSIAVNYSLFRQFRCENICCMAGIQFPSSYCFEYRDNFIKGYQPLGALQLQEYYQRSPSTISISIMDERSLFSFLLLQANLICSQPDQRILDKLQSLHKLPKESPKQIDQTETDRPSLKPDLSKWIQFCPIGNRFLRDKELPNKISESIRVNPELSYIFTMAQMLERLPFSINQTVYRSASYILSQKQGDICVFKNFLSTTKNAQVAEFFIKKSSDNPHAIFKIKHYSGRSIGQFTAYKEEQQVIFSPFTKFIIRSVKLKTNEMILFMEELPQPRNKDRKHVIWIGKDVDTGIKLINSIRQSYSKQSQLIDILPFQDNEMLQTSYQNSPYYRIHKQRTIVVFSLSGSLQQRLWRLKFIKQVFTASLYINFNPTKQDYLEEQVINPISFAKNTVQVEQLITNKFFGASINKITEKNLSLEQQQNCSCKDVCQII